VTRYESGRRYEWAYRQHLRSQGYTVVRTAGSKGPVDLIYWHTRKASIVTLVFAAQLKRTASCAEARRVLAHLRTQYPGWCEVVHKNPLIEFCGHWTEDRL